MPRPVLRPLEDDQLLMSAEIRANLSSMCEDTPFERFVQPKAVLPARHNAVVLRERQLLALQHFKMLPPQQPLPPPPSERLLSETLSQKFKLAYSRSLGSLSFSYPSAAFSPSTPLLDMPLQATTVSGIPGREAPSRSNSSRASGTLARLAELEAKAGMSSSLPSLPRVPAVPTADMVKLHEQRLDRRRGHSLMLTGGAPLHPETDWKLRLLQKNLHSNHKLIHTLPLSPENAFYLESRKRRSEAKAAEEEAARKAASEASAAKQAPTSTSGRLKKSPKPVAAALRASKSHPIIATSSSPPPTGTGGAAARRVPDPAGEAAHRVEVAKAAFDQQIREQEARMGGGENNEQDQNAAATKLQSKERSRQASKEVEEKRTQRSAAVRMQAAARGRQVRQSKESREPPDSQKMLIRAEELLHGLDPHLVSAFKQFDSDQSGGIDAAELVPALRLLGLRADAFEVESIKEKYSSPGQDLNLDQFARMVQDFEQQQAPGSPSPIRKTSLARDQVSEEVRVAFERADTNGSGAIDQTSCGVQLRALGMETTREQASII